MSRLGMSRSQLTPEEGGPTILDVNCERKRPAFRMPQKPSTLSQAPCLLTQHLGPVDSTRLRCRSGVSSLVACLTHAMVDLPPFVRVSRRCRVLVPAPKPAFASRLCPGSALALAFAPCLAFSTAGFLRDKTLQNIYRPRRDSSERVVAEAVSFKPSQLQLYGSIFERIHAKLMSVFNLTSLYFTAPTFVARLKGAPDWTPSSEHDEYYHP